MAFRRAWTLVAVLAAGWGLGAQGTVPPAGRPSEMPAEFKVASESWDHTRREVMIPMRDGVKLRTFILIPKGAKDAPILLTRTPYSAREQTTHASSPLSINREKVGFRPLHPMRPTWRERRRRGCIRLREKRFRSLRGR